MHALLPIDAADVGDDRFEVLAQPQAVTKSVFIGILLLQRLGGVASREEAVDLRVPDVVIDAIEHPTELLPVEVQGVLQTLPLIRASSFPGMLR